MASETPGPIGVFDSGVGGLTVVRELVLRFPSEPLVYFGDTARVPYGTKSRGTVERFAVEDMSFLMQFDPRIVVVACNTASANALERLRSEFDVPIIDVVTPGAERACSETTTGRIGLIATEATVKSEAYEKAVHAIDTDIHVFPKACPLLVPLVEEGRAPDDPVVKAVAWEYLSAFDGLDIDTLILGCTHYPVIRSTISKLMPGVTVVDSASAAARAVENVIGRAHQQPDRNPTRTFYVSDNPERFRSTGKRITGLQLEDVRLVDLSDIVRV